MHNVMSYLGSSEKYWIEYRAANAPTESDKDIALRTMEWIPQQPDTSDYMSTLQKCIIAGAITDKRVGVLVSAVHVFHKSMERAAEAAMPKANEWLGDIKQRLKGLTATVHRVNFTEGHYGVTTIITLHTGEGNELVWMASGAVEVERGEVWTFDGTVVAHNQWKDTKQTKINRVVYKIKGQEKAA
jgi:hypothetical protein